MTIHASQEGQAPSTSPTQPPATWPVWLLLMIGWIPGIIAAAVQSGKARRLGYRGRPYWFPVFLLGGLWAALIVALAIAGSQAGGSASPAPAGNSQPHQSQPLPGPAQTTFVPAACSGETPASGPAVLDMTALSDVITQLSNSCGYYVQFVNEGNGTAFTETQYQGEEIQLKLADNGNVHATLYTKLVHQKNGWMFAYLSSSPRG